MKALPLTLQFDDDINNYPLDNIVTIKGEPYHNIIKIKGDELLYSINNPLPIQSHRPHIHIDNSFLAKISSNIRQAAVQDLSYQKTY